MSAVAYLMESSKLCTISSKFRTFAVSSFWAAVSCSCAFSNKSVSVETMPPLFDTYTSPAGAPVSASSSPCCTKAVSFAASVELRADACTMTVSACATVSEFLICIIDAPPAISFSRIPMARWRVPMISVVSFSVAAKSAASSALTLLAFARSVSSADMAAASSSTLVLSAAMVESSFAMAAVRSATSAFAVLISKASCLERSPQVTMVSSYCVFASAPSAEILASKSESIVKTLSIGVPLLA
mmetsp:Transcript_13564/g.24509  ORF Transcript_13564/g.24509 Transcript_13564/m.24509 type:complete len:243 (-) Transcript_13564:136-864(-)